MSEFLGEIHPLAADYPLLGVEELADLAQSIREQGQLDPITVSPDGVLLDGRNRLAACELAGVEPKFETYDGDAVAFIVGKNATRRQLSSGQRAMALAFGMWERGDWDAGANKWRYGSRSIVADATIRVGSADLAMCGSVLAHSRDLAREVLAGTASLRATYDTVQDERRAAANRAAQMDTLRDKAPDLATQVADDSLTLAEAYAAYEARHAEELEAERRDHERRREQATALAKALATLGALTITESRTRIRDEWSPELSSVNPADVTPKHMRAVAAALTKLADEWSSK